MFPRKSLHNWGNKWLMKSWWWKATRLNWPATSAVGSRTRRSCLLQKNKPISNLWPMQQGCGYSLCAEKLAPQIDVTSVWVTSFGQAFLCRGINSITMTKSLYACLLLSALRLISTYLCTTSTSISIWPCCHVIDYYAALNWYAIIWLTLPVQWICLILSIPENCYAKCYLRYNPL